MFSKSYSLKFIDSTRLVNDSVEPLVNNLTHNIHNMKWKHFVNYKDCAKCEKCKDDSFEWCRICNACKKLADYCKESRKRYADYNCYLEYKEVRDKCFNFWVRKVWKNIAISLECHKSKFLDLVNNFCEKDLEKFVLLLRKDVMCYECIDSWEKIEEKSLSSR